MLDCNFVATIVDFYASEHGVPQDIHNKIVNRVRAASVDAAGAFQYIDATDGYFYAKDETALFMFELRLLEHTEGCV